MHLQINNSFYINQDALQLLQELKACNKKVQCIITDPPYGVDHASFRRKNKDTIFSKGILNDKNNLALLDQSLQSSYDVLEANGHIYWFTKWDQVSVQVPIFSKYYKLKNILIWDKGHHSTGDLFHSYGNKYECILFGSKGRKPLNEINGKKRHNDILSYPRVTYQRLLHPHQKPIELLEFLINKSSQEGDIILDMFAGIGSILSACLKTNRNCISSELDTYYYQVGKKYITDNFVQYINTYQEITEEICDTKLWLNG